MSKYILPYKMGSESARSIARGLNILQIKGHKRLGSFSEVINWGNRSVTPITNRRLPAKIYNRPGAVNSAANKISCFNILKSAGVRTPDFTNNATLAQQWVMDDHVVYGRSLVDSSQGRGIYVLTQDEVFRQGLPLYTKQVVGKEYRVHVAFDKIIDYTQKKRQREVNNNEYIRSHANGWVFARDGVVLPPDVAIQCFHAITALGLDFGAFDVICDVQGRAHILECNTAPGIENTTLEKYLQIFRNKLNL